MAHLYSRKVFITWKNRLFLVGVKSVFVYKIIYFFLQKVSFFIIFAAVLQDKLGSIGRTKSLI